MPINNIRLAVLVMLICVTWRISAQETQPRAVKILNVADGLPQSFISGLVQDSTGFIWIATRDGLARYDGKKFKIFRHVPGDTATLANNTITSLYLDQQNRLWIEYETRDIDVLHTKTETVFHFTKDPLFRTVLGTVYNGNDIVEDAKGNIWMLSRLGGVFVCNLNKRTVQFYPEKTLGLQHRKIMSITSDKGTIKFITNTALITLDENRKVIENIPYTFKNPDLYHPDVRWIKALHTLDGKRVVTHDKNRLIIYTVRTKQFTTLPLPGGAERNDFFITQDNKSQVFFNNNNTIYKLSDSSEITVWKAKNDNPAYGFNHMLIDRSGVIWLGGNGSGLHLYDMRLSRITGETYEKSFHEDILLHYLKVPLRELTSSFLKDMHGFYFRWMQDQSGKLWFSQAIPNVTTQLPVCYYNSEHLVHPSWNYTDTALSRHANINAMAVSRSGKIWGMDFYLRPVFFDTLTQAVTVYPAVTDKVDLQHSFTVNSLFIEGEDRFWFSTALNGLFLWDKKNNKTIQYAYSEAPGAVPTNQLMNIVPDPFDKNSLWIGSLGGGLLRFDKTAGMCRAFTTADGLPNNTVYAIIENNGLLWCSTNKGIFSFDPRKGIVLQSFTSKDGLPGDEFNRYHFFQLPDGRVAFGGVDGYTVFNPLTLAQDDYDPAIALTGITINNAPADFGQPASPLKAAVNSLDRIELPYTKNFLTFEFTALQYNITEKLQYRYMLEGFDEKWVNAGNNNVATYTKLPPGNYVLKLNATNTAGRWSNQVKTVSVVIQPPFWKTSWFITLNALAIAAGIYFFYKRSIAKVRREEQQKARFEREASELKAQALRAQMNPHFIFNCLNSIKALIQEDSKRQAVTYLTTFSKLIRNQLNNAQQEISLYEELETCRLYTQLEGLRFSSRIACEFAIEEGVDLHAIQVPPLILQPFIENAIWHGILPKEGGTVRVSVTGGEQIKVKIDDDGIGRARSVLNKSHSGPTYQSKGMKLVQGRLSLHNSMYNRGGSIEVVDKKDEDGNPAGTLVVVTFKLDA